MSERAVTALNWSIPSDDLQDKWRWMPGVVYLLWPTPVEPDEWFKNAGFVEFGDGSSHDEISRMNERLIEYLWKLRPNPSEKQSWISKLFGPSQQDWVNQLDTFYWDDREECKLLEKTSGIGIRAWGTQIWEVTLPKRDDEFIQSLAAYMAEGRLVQNLDLNWSRFGNFP